MRISPLFLALFSCCLSYAKPIERIAFGSCAHQNREQPIWEGINAYKPEAWIWMGDNIYGDSPDVKVLKEKWAKQKAIPGYVALRQYADILATWDDHDYGVNDGGKEYPSKKASQQAFLDFIDEPQNSPRRRQEGVYWTHSYRNGKEQVDIILLDVRYFRDPIGSNGDILGPAQWAWLEDQLQNSKAALQVIVSGIQFLHEEHRWERWSNFPQAHERLLDLIAAKAKGRVVLLSGDRHISEMAAIRHGPNNKELVEVTSSSMTHSTPNFKGEPNKHRIRDVYSKNNFGSIDIDWKQRKIQLSIRDISGKTQRTLELDL